MLRHCVERFRSIWNHWARLSQQMLWHFCPALRAEALCIAGCCNVKCNCRGNFLGRGSVSVYAQWERFSVCSEHTKQCCFLSLGGMKGFLPEDSLGFTLGMCLLISCSCTSVSSPPLPPVSKDPLPVLTSGPRDKMRQLGITVILNCVSDIKPERFTWVYKGLNRGTSKCLILNCQW